MMTVRLSTGNATVTVASYMAGRSFKARAKQSFTREVHAAALTGEDLRLMEDPGPFFFFAGSWLSTFWYSSFSCSLY